MESEVKRTFGRGAKYVPGDNPVPDLLVDPDDMLMVEPPCHPFEPLKVDESWRDPIHCLVCGERFVVD
ncbi:hypothetical protein [Amycolatopsis sp. CA-126428]|uniref:hypothetical protein n=1 Tax=Amycolatopsis sp. CA-126428 TaxID=2073158 RepID=UPI0011AFFF4A|nr:hypothetical protein [Amycolatopsis sp. CA-126428]